MEDEGDVSVGAARMREATVIAFERGVSDGDEMPESIPILAVVLSILRGCIDVGVRLPIIFGW